jgi:HTH-type transcriptional regulator, sugar sensing transcriptional regulator
MNTQILESIGLTPGEIKTYLALLKLGSSSTGPIAKESQVSRSKLYSILDKLEKKGLASHIEQNGITHFQAVEPNKIKDYLKKKEEELKQLSNDFNNFLPQLEAFHKEGNKDVNVVVYQGMKGMMTAHEHLYLKLKRGECYYGLGIPAFQPEVSHLYWQRDHVRRIKTGIKCKLLFNRDTDQEIVANRNTYKGADARFMPTDIKTPAWISTYKDTTFISIQFPSYISIEIINQGIADSFQAYFDEFWKRSVPFTKIC